MSFDDFFRRATRIAGLSTQKDLARILGIDPAAITLAKRRGVPRVWVLTLADKFGVNPEWLRTGLGPERGHDDAVVPWCLRCRQGPVRVAGPGMLAKP